MELGQPHLDEARALYRLRPADEVVRRYLAELVRMVAGGGTFAVVTHVEYAARYWPTEQEGPFDPSRFEDEFRQALLAISASGRALEFNLGGQVRPWILRWWQESGGRALTLASDAHTPDRLAGNFPVAMAMAEHAGFRPGRRPEDFWTR